MIFYSRENGVHPLTPLFVRLFNYTYNCIIEQTNGNVNGPILMARETTSYTLFAHEAHLIGSLGVPHKAARHAS